MNITSLANHILYDGIMIVLGSYGTYVLINEFVESDSAFSISNLFSIIRKRWYALLALVIAVILFLDHIVAGLSS